MKKVLSTLVIAMIALSTLSIYAYTPTQSDKVLLTNIDQKIDSLYQTDPDRLERIGQKILGVMNSFDKETRVYYILVTLLDSITSKFTTPVVQMELEEFYEDEGIGYNLTEVVDGDTIKLNRLLEEPFTVRLLGVNAPESFDTFGSDATSNLQKLLSDETITLVDDEILGETYDDYDRRIAYIYVGEKNVNAEQIKAGYARELTYEGEYSLQSQFRAYQQQAEESKLGIWSVDGCQAKRYCTEMISCEEAKYYLTECNVYSLDRDEDGIPCESICL